MLSLKVVKWGQTPHSYKRLRECKYVVALYIFELKGAKIHD